MLSPFAGSSNGERAAVAGFALDARRGRRCARDDVVDHRQSDAGAVDATVARLLAAVKLRKIQPLLARRDSDARVAHA